MIYYLLVDMAEMKFTFVEVDKKESRKYRKGSKYDPILDKFASSKQKMAKLEIETDDPNYLRLQIKKRIDSRELPVKVSVTNGIIYFERE